MIEPTARRRHASPEQRREQILAAALDCFAARGYHAARMDDLVRASGLSKGSLYWHFSSKEEVFLALFDRLAGEIFARFDAAASSGRAHLMELLAREVEIFLDGLGRERKLLLAWTEFLSHPRGRERMAAIYRTSREKLAGLIREGIARGELRDDLPVEATAAAITGCLDAIVLQAVLDPAFETASAMHTLVEMLRSGLVQTAQEAEEVLR